MSERGRASARQGEGGPCPFGAGRRRQIGCQAPTIDAVTVQVPTAVPATLPPAPMAAPRVAKANGRPAAAAAASPGARRPTYRRRSSGAARLQSALSARLALQLAPVPAR